MREWPCARGCGRDYHARANGGERLCIPCVEGRPITNLCDRGCGRDYPAAYAGERLCIPCRERDDDQPAPRGDSESNMSSDERAEIAQLTSENAGDEPFTGEGHRLGE